MDEGKWVECDCLTKYVCLKCSTFACNKSLECYIPASEKHPCLKECKKVALCLKCHKQEHKLGKKQKEHTDDPDFQEKEAETDGYKLVILFSSRRFTENYMEP